MTRIISAAAVFALASAAAVAGQPTRFALEPDQVLLTYQASLGHQQLSGVSRALRGSVEQLPGGGLHLAARVPVSSFASGSPRLDALFARLLDSDRFPEIELEGQAQAPANADQANAIVNGTLTLHGVTRPVQAAVRVVRDGRTLFVKTSFALDLESYGLAAPAIGGLKVSPKIQIELHALLRPAEASAMAARTPRG